MAGRADVLALTQHRDDDAQWTRFGRIPHPGTFNGNPLSAAAGIACLEIVRDPAIQQRATATADRIRQGVDDVLRRRGVEGSAGGEVSLISVSLPGAKAKGTAFQHKLRSAMQLGGVDYSGSFIVSAVHDDRDVAQTVDAFDNAVRLLQAENLL